MLDWTKESILTETGAPLPLAELRRRLGPSDRPAVAPHDALGALISDVGPPEGLGGSACSSTGQVLDEARRCIELGVPVRALDRRRQSLGPGGKLAESISRERAVFYFLDRTFRLRRALWV